MFDILTEDDFPKVDANDVVVDAIFGSGLNRPPQGMTADLIAYLNQSKAIRVAIDIPSGLFADQPSALGFIFKADYTLTFQNPKLAFLLPENDPYVGRFEVLDIGLHPRYLEEVETNNLLTVKAMVKAPNPFRGRWRRGCGVWVCRGGRGLPPLARSWRSVSFAPVRV